MTPNTVATSAAPEYRTMDSAPMGAKCLLLTAWGVAVIGVASDDIGYVGWAPLPKIPPNIKRKLRRYDPPVGDCSCCQKEQKPCDYSCVAI